MGRACRAVVRLFGLCNETVTFVMGCAIPRLERCLGAKLAIAKTSTLSHQAKRFPTSDCQPATFNFNHILPIPNTHTLKMASQVQPLGTFTPPQVYEKQLLTGVNRAH